MPTHLPDEKKATKDFFLKAVKQFFVLWIGRLKFLTSLLSYIPHLYPSPPSSFPSLVCILTSHLSSIPCLHPHLFPLLHPSSVSLTSLLSSIPHLYPSPPSSLPSLICIPHLPPLFHPSSVSLTSLLSSIPRLYPHLPPIFYPL